MKRVTTLGVGVALLTLLTLWEIVSLVTLHYPGEGYIFTTDSALSTEAHFIRERSVTDLVEVFGQGPGLLPYFASDYTYHPPPYLNAHSRLERGSPALP
ncbi:MAG: hypothetical protein GXO19_04205 [Epsilonproteobacteria bacterium]|nr:hypothetical protein [Campylobacterota bacterium]NPA56925.1 hypothetical protein [Campylobacterota bacterium]